MLALAGAAYAQTPGDEQYVDPFGSGQQDQPAASGDEQEEPAPAEPEPAAPQPAEPAPATTAQATPEPQQQLPYTGADEGLVALVGVVLLAGGVALRVTSGRAPRP
jgi:hypothetical protein